MSEEQKNIDEPVSAESVTEANKKKIVTSNGQEVTLEPEDMAIVVVFSPRTGRSAVYDVQNTSLRAYSRMLLNEAITTYEISTHANVTALTLAQMFAEGTKDKKGGIHTPFTK